VSLQLAMSVPRTYSPFAIYYVHVTDGCQKISPPPKRPGGEKRCFRKLPALKLNQPGIGELNPCARSTKLRLRPLSMVRARICTTGGDGGDAAAGGCDEITVSYVQTKPAHPEAAAHAQPFESNNSVGQSAPHIARCMLCTR